MQDKGSTCQELVADIQEPGFGRTKLWEGSVMLINRCGSVTSRILSIALDKELETRGKPVLLLMCCK